MINLDSIKIVLFDFDDTLCIHTNHSWNEDIEFSQTISILQLGKNAWSTCQISSHMEKFMKECESKNIPMGLVSVVMSAKHMMCKQDWVLEKYGIFLENYCVGKAEDKIKVMRAISEAYGIPKSKILIVDDLWQTVSDAYNEGFLACSPMEVVNYIEQKREV